MMLAIIAALFVVLSSAAFADGVYIIEDDGGGFVSSYETHYNALKMGKIPVQIAGDCVSACTMVFALPAVQVCAWPGSRLGFHYVESDDKVNVQATREWAEHFYPPEVAMWLLSQQPDENNDPIYRDAMDFFPQCQGNEPEYLKRKPVAGSPDAIKN